MPEGETRPMHLETSDGTRTSVDEPRLARILERPAPLIALRGPGTALVALHACGRCYRLLYWNGRTWQHSTPDVPESTLARRFIDFFNGGGDWRGNLVWETLRREAGTPVVPALPPCLHVMLTFILIFGGFATGIFLGVTAGRQIATHAPYLVYIGAILFAPPLAILGQLAARRIPSACDQCGEPAINLQTGRFAYLCTECGRLNITRWGIHRGPMAP